MDGEDDVLAQALEMGLERPGGIGGEEVVVFGHVTPHHGVDGTEICRSVLDRREAVEGHDGGDCVRAGTGEHETQHPAHAEADHADAVPGRGVVVEQVVDGSTHVGGGTVDRQ